MKKTSIYFIVPLIGLVLFGVGYWRFYSNYKVERDERAAEVKRQREEEAQRKYMMDQKAYEIAVAESTKRQAALAERKARDSKEREDRQNAVNELSRVRSEVIRLESQVSQLRRDVADAKDAFDAVELRKKEAASEIAHQQEITKMIVARQQESQANLLKYEEAERARIELERLKAAEAANR